VQTQPTLFPPDPLAAAVEEILSPPPPRARHLDDLSAALRRVCGIETWEIGGTSGLVDVTIRRSLHVRYQDETRLRRLVRRLQQELADVTPIGYSCDPAHVCVVVRVVVG